MSLWKFTIDNDVVRYGTKKRQQLTPTGCNEPFRDRFWCPKLQWFQKESCPFVNKRECMNYEDMCGSV